MADYALIRSLISLSKTACAGHVYLRVFCLLLSFVAWDSLNATQTSERASIGARVIIQTIGRDGAAGRHKR
jgi:hypothetical protein